MSIREQPSDPPSPPSDPGGRGEAAPDASGPGRPRAWAIAAGMVAGLLAWFAAEPLRETFTLTAEERAGGVSAFGGSDKSLYLAGLRRIASQNAALHYGILGAALAGALGMAGGLSRRSAPGAAVGAAFGVVAGGLAGGLATLGLAPVFLANYRPDRPDLILPFLVHGGIWTAIGVAAGLAMGIGRRGVAGEVIGEAMGGAVGALLGTVAYEVAVAVAFPLVRIESPMPKDQPAMRALAFLAVALGVSIGVSWAATPRRRSAAGPGAGAVRGQGQGQVQDPGEAQGS